MGHGPQATDRSISHCIHSVSSLAILFLFVNEASGQLQEGSRQDCFLGMLNAPFASVSLTVFFFFFVNTTHLRKEGMATQVPLFTFSWVRFQLPICAVADWNRSDSHTVWQGRGKVSVIRNLGCNYEIAKRKTHAGEMSL